MTTGKIVVHRHGGEKSTSKIVRLCRRVKYPDGMRSANGCRRKAQVDFWHIYSSNAAYEKSDTMVYDGTLLRESHAIAKARTFVNDDYPHFYVMHNHCRRKGTQIRTEGGGVIHRMGCRRHFTQRKEA